ncbi:hypothetical protein IGI04_016055 [Brassica rapa subsp. trilocularis]|uniref:Uncharacterized protein n=1 Tax=Brassica rapa subsp. trilocularis TaxID=1813537 RepID=A0ABQ7MRU8_BRACM|nr:hypothetical protein IGI04_016055 [Brassica rapa subsp. trilocularis]
MSTTKMFFISEQTLKDFSEDSRKTSQNTLGKSYSAYYARRLPTKSSESLPKSSVQGDFSDLSQTLENFSVDSWKTLIRHLEKSSKAFYAIRLPTKSSESLLP